MVSIQGRLWAPAFAAFLLLVLSAGAADRPLPEDVNVKVYVRPAQGALELLVQVPLSAVKDVQFPARADGYLDLGAIKSMLPGMARYWIANCFEIDENGVPVPPPEIKQTRISISSDQSFDSYQEAFAHFDSPDLPLETNVLWDQVWLDIRYQYPLRSEQSTLAIRPKLAALGVRVSTDLKYVNPDGGVRDFSFEGDPGLVYLDARLSDAAKQFLQWGFTFALKSTDFLLFVFCLSLPLRRYREIAPAVACFLISLSVALVVCAFALGTDPVWFRPLIETLSAIAILFTAFANIAGHVTPPRRALLALSVGSVYGLVGWFDFAGKVQFGGSHSVLAAVSYDVGIVIAVVAAISVLVPLLSFLFRFARTERVELIVISALAADTAWGWLEQRWGRLIQLPFRAIVLDLGVLAFTLRVLAIFVLAAGLVWFADGWLKSRTYVSENASSHERSRTAV
jgi:hypothetical protein